MNEFYLNGGGTISNMEQLAKMLPKMDDQVFCYHCNAGKNDFANWVRDVFHQDALAREIARMDKNHMAKAIEKHFRHHHGLGHVARIHHMLKH